MKEHDCKSILKPDWINVKCFGNQEVWVIEDKGHWILTIKYCPYCGEKLK